MFKLRTALVAGIVGLGLLASPSVAGDLSGMLSLTTGKTSFYNLNNDYNDINIFGQSVTNGSTGQSFSVGNQSVIKYGETL